MNTKKYSLSFLIVLITVLTLALSACSTAAAPTPQTLPDSTETPVISDELTDELTMATPVSDFTIVDDEGNTDIDIISLQDNLSTTSGELTEAEIEGLLYMREEEKLARDVYLVLYEIWGLPIFQNIANSEQTHTDAVKVLLDSYGVEDPSAGTAPGEFTNAELQALYDQLTAQGEISISDALKVGLAIEEIDILDLELYMTNLDNPTILTVYENLMKGSRNHLRSFVSTLSRQTGEVYEPQYMSETAYQEIVGSAIEAGGNGRGGNGNRP